jgi:hypothetical protein
LSISGVFGLLILGYGISEGASLGIVAGLALVAVDEMPPLTTTDHRRSG